MVQSNFNPSDMFPFRIPAYPNLMHDLDNNKLHMMLTEQSKQFWENGQPGQGYIGLIELPISTDPDPNLIKIHLIPSFNKDDGLIPIDKNTNEFVLEKKDKNGKPLPAHLISAQPRGAFTGDLHLNAARSLGLGHKGQQNGLLMGFGLWKAGAAIRIISENMSLAALVPHEYIITAHHTGDWTLDYVDDSLNIKRIDINEIVGLKEALSKLDAYNLEKLSIQDRQKSGVDDVIRAYEHQKSLTLDDNNIKYAKNRSTSQNMNAIDYLPEYQLMFNSYNRNQQAHMLNLKREIPLPIFQYIMNSVCDHLRIANVGDLTVSNVIPRGSDALQNHLQFYNDWQNENGFFPFLEKMVCQFLINKNYKYGDTKASFGALSEGFHSAFKNNTRQKTEELIAYYPPLALILAISSGDLPLVTDLINNHGIDPNVPFTLNRTALTIDSSEREMFPIKREVSPLELAGRLGEFDIMLALIRRGANPDVEIDRLGTPLIIAAKNADIDTVRGLLNAGADPNYRDSHARESALYVAARTDNFELAQILLNHGADANQFNIADQRAWEVCASEKMKDLILLNDFSKMIPDNYQAQAKEIVSTIFLAIINLPPLGEKSVIDKFSPENIGQQCESWLGNMVQYNPDTDVSIKKFFRPIITEVTEFIKAFKIYMLENPTAYENEHVSILDKSLKKIDRQLMEYSNQNSFSKSQGMWELSKHNANENEKSEIDIPKNKGPGL